MNTPSIKTLTNVFGANAKQAKHILTVTDTRSIHTPSVAALRSVCFNPPGKRYVRLTALNELAETFGIECAETTSGEYAEYLNTGDTYAMTLIYWRGNYRVQSLGDFVETLERNGVQFK